MMGDGILAYLNFIGRDIFIYITTVTAWSGIIVKAAAASTPLLNTPCNNNEGGDSTNNHQLQQEGMAPTIRLPTAPSH